MNKLKEFLKGKPWYVKLIILIALSALVYFNSGCAYKFHADSIDNVTQEFLLKNKE